MRGYEVPKPILMHWYLCGRKRPFMSAEAEAQAAERGRQPYPCPFADDGHWHVGRPPAKSPDRPRWRPHDERRRLLRNAAKTWDWQAYRSPIADPKETS